MATVVSGKEPLAVSPAGGEVCLPLVMEYWNGICAANLNVEGF